MDLANDPQSQFIIGAMLALLSLASLIGWILKKRLSNQSQLEVIKNLNARIKAWWVMVITFFIAATSWQARFPCIICLYIFSCHAGVYYTHTNKKSRSSNTFWAFFVIMPIHYYLLAINWLALYLIFIPVYAYLWIPIRNAIAGDTTDFLGRMAKIQWALMICVYFVSYAPALLDLRAPGYEHQGAKLLCFFVFIVQMSDVLQYVFGKLFGKHKISANVSPNKTVEGFIGGGLCAVILGSCLYWMTPFNPWQAAPWRW